MIILKVLSRLLQYPDADLASDVAEMIEIVEREPLLDSEDRRALIAHAQEVGGGDLIERQERYTELFDRSRSLSLHLFEHVHGESRDRGQAMVDLLARYEEAGLTLSAAELPDYLPLFLEYLSLLEPGRALADLAEPIALISALRDRLEKRRSSYAAVFRALEHLAAVPAAKAAGAAAGPAGEVGAAREADDGTPLTDDDPNDLAAIDREYAEEAVSFMETPRQAAIGSLLARRAASGSPLGNPLRTLSSHAEGRS